MAVVVDLSLTLDARPHSSRKQLFCSAGGCGGLHLLRHAADGKQMQVRGEPLDTFSLAEIRYRGKVPWDSFANLRR